MEDKWNICFGDTSVFAIEVANAEVISTWLLGTVYLWIHGIRIGNGSIAPLGVFYGHVEYLQKALAESALNPLGERLFHMEYQEAFNEIYFRYFDYEGYGEDSRNYGQYTFCNIGEFFDNYTTMLLPYGENLKILVRENEDNIQCFNMTQTELWPPIADFLAWSDNVTK